MEGGFLLTMNLSLAQVWPREVNCAYEEPVCDSHASICTLIVTIPSECCNRKEFGHPRVVFRQRSSVADQAVFLLCLGFST